ncbi:Dyp-type peroxidase family protein [Paraburkholderia xenovorans LB400]|jgi:porphyrinogen peroxidase|uniref:Dyp-type peroxidase n=1 Tax=Paraburkholderia xenovorans (strain LB400) TaxID=266265 RepID=Q144S4_PARXL|nr:Dyp-type peroxidase [Paraburkholderia xenovorans]ABE29165.1 Dyp-type peroxidase [Paraburkholderia xenovorans LB400]AIP32354.1 Dyp-type peroxidase family protein [Paraburkholderia xenovorans LB400]EIF28266.1 Dyp-type peroxidase family [Burkholderia sp. Ch1-1]NPT35395.1 Dyp-type peroxidase [Paraburkholderia xenovorans]
MPKDIPEPQAICNDVTRSAIFIVATIEAGRDHADKVRAWCGDVAALVRSVGRRVPSGNLSCVCGFGSDAWDTLFGAPRPAGLHPFREFGSGERLAVATPGDILLHIRAEHMDLCFELATQLLGALGDAVTVTDEVHGFRNFDMRAMVGFVDGTENPAGRAAEKFTLIADEDPEFEGGSYVIVQKYLHDMAGWNALSVETQERIIGRTKLSDIELDEAVKPSCSHSSLTTLTENGEEVKILRDNMPFGRPGAGEFGTYFIGYARSPAPTEQMLENMFVGRPPGNYDRLLDYSRAVTGGLFFVPSATLLEALADRDPQASAAAADGGQQPDTSSSAEPQEGGSLNIGSLKGISQYE